MLRAPSLYIARAARILLIAGIALAALLWRPPLAAADPPLVGYLYKLEGHINGQPVVYIGSAAGIKERLTKGHYWSPLLRQRTTKVSYKKVFADLALDPAKGLTLERARGQALLAMEQPEIERARKQAEKKNRKRKPGRKSTKILNAKNAASDPATWQARHNASSSKRWRVFRKPGTPAMLRSAGGVLFIIEAFRLYYDYKRSRFVMAPYVLEDEGGAFTLDYKRDSWLDSRRYDKNYIAGPNKGYKVQVSESEFYDLAAEAKALWGTLDWGADFVPGLLRPTLPIIDRDAA